MILEYKMMWINALESGEYTKGSRFLCQRTPEGVRHCSQGVLIAELDKRNLLVVRGIVMHGRWGNGMNGDLMMWPSQMPSGGISYNESTLTREVAELTGIAQHPMVPAYGSPRRCPLTAVNDDLDDSLGFGPLIPIIEKYL